MKEDDSGAMADRGNAIFYVLSEICEDNQGERALYNFLNDFVDTCARTETRDLVTGNTHRPISTLDLLNWIENFVKIKREIYLDMATMEAENN